MSTQQVEILFICGSPRAHTSEALLALLEQGVRETGARSRKFLLSKRHISPCNGCGYCEQTGSCVMADERAETQSSDDYLELLDALEHADGLAVVSPLFFAGPPAKLKALYDRMQPFWARRYVLDQKPRPKRPAQVFFLGGGGDTYGFDPLVTTSKSALAVAGFTVEKVLNFIGFKFPGDVPALPNEEEAAHIAFGELAHLRKAIATQQEFEERAVAAGRAFARYVSKQLQKTSQDVELQLYGTKVLPDEATVLSDEVSEQKDAEQDDVAPEHDAVAAKQSDGVLENTVVKQGDNAGATQPNDASVQASELHTQPNGTVSPPNNAFSLSNETVSLPDEAEHDQ